MASYRTVLQVYLKVSVLLFLPQCLSTDIQHRSLGHLSENSESIHVEEQDTNVFWDVCSWYFQKARFIVVSPIESQMASDFTEELLPLIHDKLSKRIVVSQIGVPHTVKLFPERVWKNLSVLRQAFILVVQQEELLINFLRFIKQNVSYQLHRNPRANFLIISLVTSDGKKNQINREELEAKYFTLLQILWEDFGILNVVVMVVNYSTYYYRTKLGDIIMMASFNPFAHSVHSRGQLVVYKQSDVVKLLINYDRLCDLKGYPIHITLFSRKPTSFPLHPADNITDYVGVDGFFMRTLAHCMNFTAIVKAPEDSNEYGFMFENNGTFSGSIGDILYDKADISLNSRFVKSYGTDDIEFTLTVGFDSLCIVVPKAKQLPKWNAFFRVFHCHVLFAIISVYVICSLICHVLKRIYYSFKQVKNHKIYWISTFIEMLPPFLSLSLVRMPSSRPEKIFVMTCLLFGMIMASSFQGKLVTVLSKSDYYSDIQTLEELDQSGLVIGTGSLNLVDDTFSTEESSLVKHLSKKVTYLSMKESIVGYVSKHQDVAALSRLSNALSSELQYRNSDGSYLLHIVEECPRIYPLAYIVPRGSPYLPRINHVITRLIESGIIKQWTAETYFNMTVAHRNAYNDNDSLKVFSLEDLQMAFLELTCGLFGSIIVFMLELLVNRISVYNRSKSSKDVIWLHVNKI